MTLELKQFLTDSETEFTEDGVIKIRANISVHADLIGSENTQRIIFSLSVINLNSQTGAEMDAQRSAEVSAFLAGF